MWIENLIAILIKKIFHIYIVSKCNNVDIKYYFHIIL